MPDPTLPESLARYFEHMVPLCLGELTEQDDLDRAHAVLEALGSDPSEPRDAARAHHASTTPQRLALSREFVRWQAFEAMHALFLKLETAWNAFDPGRFLSEVGIFLRVSRASTPDPSSIGVGFDEFLAARTESDSSIPAWACEWADAALIRRALSQTQASRPLVPHATRFYTHPPGTHTVEPAAWIFFAIDGLVRCERISRAELIALAHADGESVELGLNSDDVAAAAPLLSRLRVA